MPGEVHCNRLVVMHDYNSRGWYGNSIVVDFDNYSTRSV